MQESGPEREDTKIDLFAAIDAAAPPETVIATSSSGLLVSRVSTKCKHPERCVIGHPFNPPHLIPLVEVVGGPKTSAEAIVKAMDFYLTAGKKPIHIKKEVAGHVANRLQAALWREVDSSRGRRRGVGFGCRCRDCLWPRPALGADGAVV